MQGWPRWCISSKIHDIMSKCHIVTELGVFEVPGLDRIGPGPSWSNWVQPGSNWTELDLVQCGPMWSNVVQCGPNRSKSVQIPCPAIPSRNAISKNQ